jgi:predicted RNase H-like HicB family nuclease
MKKNQHYQVVIEQDEDGVYVGTVLGLPSCYSDGKTIDELMENLHDAILLCEKHQEKQAKELQTNQFIGVRDLVLHYA